jgi:hypothetical protein
MRTLLNKLILIVAAGLTQAAVATPLITNGGFNTDASGWTLGGGSGCYSSWTSSGNGTGAVAMNACGSADSDPTVSQTIIGLTIGHTYLLSWDQKLDSAYSGYGYGKTFGIFLGADGGTPLYTNEIPNTTWQSMSTSFVATSTSQLITFASELDQRTTGVTLRTDVSYQIDNVSLKDTSVPEPASIMLIGLGLAGLSARLRRKSA